VGQSASTIAGPALWARSEIRRGWRALVLVAMLIAIVGAGVMATVSGARRAGTAIERFVEASERASVLLYTDEPPDDRLIARFASDRRVDHVETGRLHAIAPVGVLPAAEGATWTMPDGAVGAARTPIVVEGRAPAGGFELGLDETTARALDLAVGDDVELLGLPFSQCAAQGDCEPFPAATAELVGLIRTEQDLAPDPEDWTILLAGDLDLDPELADSTSMGWITGIWTASGEDPEEFIGAYAADITNGEMTNEASRTTEPLASAYRAADLEHDAVLIGAAVVAVVGLVLIAQTYGRFLARRHSDVPGLCALGMSRSQVTLAGWFPAVVASMLGATVAVPLTVAVSPLFPLQTARRADPDVGFNADVSVLAIGVLVLLAISVSAALLSVWSWSRDRPAPPPRPEVSLGARIAALFGLGPAAAMGTRFALERGTGTHRVPIVPALLGAVSTVLLATAATVITASLQHAQTDPATYGVTWDFEVNTDSDPEQTNATPLIDGDERIESATFVMTGQLGVTAADGETRGSAVIGVRELTGRFDYTVLEGQPPASANEVGFSTEAMRRFGASVGDTVTLSGPAGSRDVEIAGRVGYANADGSTADGLLADLAVLLDLGGTDQVPEINLQAALLVTAADPSDIDGLREMFEAAGAPTDTAVRPTELGLLDEVRLVPAYIAAFVAALGALATFHTLFVTSRRRRGELMVLRALGCRPHEAAGVIRWQALVLATVAIGVGVPLGIVLGRAVWTQLATTRELVVRIDVPWSAIVSIAGVALFGAVVVLAWPPVRDVARRRPADDLRTE
jgi:ABC-type lipoprotein release transport system permease subunit